MQGSDSLCAAREWEQDSMSEHDPDMLVVLTTARTEFEAQTLAEAVRARGIRAEVFATAASSLQWEAGFTDPIKVMVRRADVAEAEKVRAALKMDSVDIDWDEVDTGAEAEQDDAPAKKSAQVTVFVTGLFFAMIIVATIAGLFASGITGVIMVHALEHEGHTSVPMYVGCVASVVVLALLWRGSRKVREEASGKTAARGE
jgi:hypothetical protein